MSNLMYSEDELRLARKLGEIFLQTHYSDKKLEEVTGINDSKIQRVLSNKNLMTMAFPDEGEKVFEEISRIRLENRTMGKVLGSATSKINYGNPDEIVYSLEVFGNDKDRQIKLLRHIVLTYRLNLDTISKLLGKDFKELYDDLTSDGIYSKPYMDYLFERDNADQVVAKNKFIEFYKSYVEARKNKDIAKINELISSVTDANVKRIKEEREPGDLISDEDIGYLLNYQLKYALSDNQVAKTCGVYRDNYRQRALEYVKDKPELANRLELLKIYCENVKFQQREGIKR